MQKSHKVYPASSLKPEREVRQEEICISSKSKVLQVPVLFSFVFSFFSHKTNARVVLQVIKSLIFYIQALVTWIPVQRSPCIQWAWIPRSGSGTACWRPCSPHPARATWESVQKRCWCLGSTWGSASTLSKLCGEKWGKWHVKESVGNVFARTLIRLLYCPL